MLIDNRCSIYAHRPKACRTYDCRIFAATGVALTDRTQVRIAARVKRWRFDTPRGADADQRDALRAAGAYLRSHPDVWPDNETPVHPTGLAVTAIAIADLFATSERDPTAPSGRSPDPATVKARIAALKAPRT